MRNLLRIAFAVAVLVISSQADVIYNTFGPDYGVGDWTWLVGHSGDAVESVAVPFASPTDVNVTQLDLVSSCIS